jgi:hypothetical protein
MEVPQFFVWKLDYEHSNSFARIRCYTSTFMNRRPLHISFILWHRKKIVLNLLNNFCRYVLYVGAMGWKRGSTQLYPCSYFLQNLSWVWRSTIENSFNCSCVLTNAALMRATRYWSTGLLLRCHRMLLCWLCKNSLPTIVALMLWMLMDGQLSYRRTQLKDQEDFLALRDLQTDLRRHTCTSSEAD